MPHIWTADEIKRVGYRVVDLIADHLTTLPKKPAFRPVPPGHAHAWLSSPPPQDPVAPDDILDLFTTAITSTELRGQFVLRACFVNHRSRREDIDRMLAAVRAIGQEITLRNDSEATAETAEHAEQNVLGGLCGLCGSF